MISFLIAEGTIHRGMIAVYDEDCVMESEINVD